MNWLKKPPWCVGTEKPESKGEQIWQTIPSHLTIQDSPTQARASIYHLAYTNSMMEGFVKLPVAAVFLVPGRRKIMIDTGMSDTEVDAENITTPALLVQPRVMLFMNSCAWKIWIKCSEVTDILPISTGTMSIIWTTLWMLFFMFRTEYQFAKSHSLYNLWVSGSRNSLWF